MRVAVTGARGFVGRHVIGELAIRNVEVVATERPGVDRDRPAAVNVRWVALDIARPPENCFAAIGRPDVLLHLAWSGLPNYRSPRHLETELPNQLRFLSNAVRNGLPALVVTGTCLEYGPQSGALAPNLATRPDTSYGAAKDTLRSKLQELQEHHPYQLTWARLFYTYGEGQSPSSLFAMLHAAVAAGQRQFPMSGGEQLRDYLPVREVARRLVELASNPADRGPINICAGKPISVRRLVESWIEQNGWSIEPKYGELPYPDHEPMEFWGVAEVAEGAAGGSSSRP